MNTNNNDSLINRENHNDKTNIVKSEHTCCTESNYGKNVVQDQNFLKKIGLRNGHPWNLIGLR